MPKLNEQTSKFFMAMANGNSNIARRFAQKSGFDIPDKISILLRIIDEKINQLRQEIDMFVKDQVRGIGLDQRRKDMDILAQVKDMVKGEVKKNIDPSTIFETVMEKSRAGIIDEIITRATKERTGLITDALNSSIINLEKEINRKIENQVASERQQIKEVKQEIDKMRSDLGLSQKNESSRTKGEIGNLKQALSDMKKAIETKIRAKSVEVENTLKTQVDSLKSQLQEQRNLNKIAFKKLSEKPKEMDLPVQELNKLQEELDKFKEEHRILREDMMTEVKKGKKERVLVAGTKTGPSLIGRWRIKENTAGDLVFEKKINGTWTEKGAFTE